MQNQVTAQQISNWISGLGHKNAIPCRITINEQTWEACRYNSVGTYKADMDAVRWGKHKAGEEYQIELLYCVGTLPKCYRKNGKDVFPKSCFTVTNDAREWYISGYIEKIEPQFAEFHPFGVNFMLTPWDVDGKVDDGEKPYKRVQMTIQNL